MSDIATDSLCVGEKEFFCHVEHLRCSVCDQMRFCVSIGDFHRFCATCLVLVAKKVDSFARASCLSTEVT